MRSMNPLLPSYLQQQASLYRLEKAKGRVSEGIEAFQQRYHDHPAAFVQECFTWKPGDEPSAYQLEILTALAEHRRVSARGPHGLGKSTLASWAVLWFALTRDGVTDWKVPITASVWRQVAKFLFPELHKWARRLDWSKVGRAPFNPVNELQVLGLKLSTGEAFGVVSDEPSAIEGAHASEILYVLDEAKAIPAPTWEAVEGAFSTGNAYALAISTPGDTGGVFYDLHKRRAGYDDWWTRHVTLQEAIGAGRISKEWADQRKKQWGETSPVYLNRVLGEFAESGTDTLIPLAWVEAANERFEECGGKGEGDHALGVDVARFGDDNSAIVRRAGKVIETVEILSQLDTMALTGEVVVRTHGDKQLPIRVDVIGIGAGVVDRLREQEFAVVGVNASTSAKDIYGQDLTDSSGELTFVNVRSYLWWLLRERLDPQGIDPIALPPMDELTGDLTAPKWKLTSAGRVQVESKDDIRKRIGRSTDAADGVALALLPEGVLAVGEMNFRPFSFDF